MRQRNAMRTQWRRTAQCVRTIELNSLIACLRRRRSPFVSLLPSFCRAWCWALSRNNWGLMIHRTLSSILFWSFSFLIFFSKFIIIEFVISQCRQNSKYKGAIVRLYSQKVFIFIVIYLYLIYFVLSLVQFKLFYFLCVLIFSYRLVLLLRMLSIQILPKKYHKWSLRHILTFNYFLLLWNTIGSQRELHPKLCHYHRPPSLKSWPYWLLLFVSFIHYNWLL